MCGRYRLAASPEELVEIFGLFPDIPLFRPRFNISPTDEVPVVVGPRGERMAKILRWGLLPPWAKHPREGAKMINARSDSIRDKPAFRKAFRHRRCLVPADGWYEWDPTTKLPWQFRLKDSVLAFAGIYETWKPPEGGPVVTTFAILTTDANGPCRLFHERMPVVLPPEAWTAWTDPEADPDILELLLRPLPDDAVVIEPVADPESVKPDRRR